VTGWDAIVIGGGCAGGICAAAIARAGHRVLLATMPASRPRLAELIAPADARTLRPWIDVANLPASDRLPCRGVVSRWGEAPTHVTDYVLERCEPGWIVRRPALDRALLDAAIAAGVETRENWRCLGISDGGVVTFETPAGRHDIGASCIVLATGRVPSARTRRMYVDDQIAFAATVEEQGSLHDLLWVESARDGWWYASAVPGSGPRIVFMTRADGARTSHSSRQRVFVEAFERTTLIRQAFARSPALGPVSLLDARLTCPMGDPSDTVIRIGDAAGSADPLSGRGCALALRSAVAAAAAIEQYLRTGVREPIRTLNACARLEHEQHRRERARLWARGGIFPEGEAAIAV
jgi:flavin-dependent dehydrogenase